MTLAKSPPSFLAHLSVTIMGNVSKVPVCVMQAIEEWNVKLVMSSLIKGSVMERIVSASK